MCGTWLMTCQKSLATFIPIRVMQCIQWKENSSHFDENGEGQYMHTTLYDLLIATTKCILYVF